MTLSDKILYCRKRQGLSQEELAEKIGVSRQAVSKWETGEAAPEISKLSALSDIFGVTADWLISDEDPVESTPPQYDTQYDRQYSPRQSPSWVEDMPSVAKKFFNKWGFMAGLYVVYTGLGTFAVGLFGKIAFRMMFGDIMAFDPGAEQFFSKNPFTLITNFAFYLGIIIIAFGAWLTYYLYKKRKDNDK